MKWLLILLLTTIAFTEISSAQNNELINSGELIKRCAALYDSGKYKSSLAELIKVNRSDTNYVWSLYEKAISCEADSQYTQAIIYCKEALSLKEQREYEPELYNTYGNTLDDMGQRDDAIKVFDSGIAKYPRYSLLHFNKGIALLALKRYADAEAQFQKTLMINPYMYSAHFQLGMAALQQGKIIPSFLSLLGYLMVNPEGKYWSKSISLLSQITKGTDEILDLKNKRSIPPGETYADVEDIVLSKIALDKAYKPIIELDDPISRQIQAVFEKLDYSESNNDFWMQYYMPYFKQVYSQRKFELFVNHIFSHANVAVIQDYNKKNKKELDQFVNDAADYFNLLRSTGELFYNKREAVTARYLFDEGKLLGKGEVTNNGKTLNGHWDFLYPAGNLKGTGNYNATGQREGDWVYYFYSGKLQAKEHYVNGKLEGQQEFYSENGNLTSRENYVADKADGLVTTYFWAGNVKSTVNYKAGKKDGEEKNYQSNGALKSVYNYAAGVVSGTVHEYFKNGQLKETEQYVNGKADGPYKSYHQNGTPAAEGQYAKDNAEGEWKYYFDNGKLQEKRNYVNSTEEGVHEEYFDNGQLSATYISKKGKMNGDAAYYDKDGKVYAKLVYDAGIIKSAKYLDKSGNQVNGEETAGSFFVYTPAGIKKSHIGYDKKGNLDGPDTLFFASGKINEINHYKDNELNGITTQYYLNGNKKSEINMTDGKENGYYTGFYVNGKPEAEGWFQDGEFEGQWIYYDELGRLTTKSYYEDGNLHGYKEAYYPDGKKMTEEKYHMGWLENVTQYDTLRNVIAVDSFPKASGKYKLIYPNGKVMTEAAYVNGDFNGQYKTYYFDGSPESAFFYNKGQLDSTYVSYYYGGIKSSEGHYKYGNKWGTWKYYDNDGKLDRTLDYVNDQINGDKTYYFPNGSKDYVALYKDDVNEGAAKRYDPDGTLAYQVVYENGKAKAYTYPGKDGTLMPLVPIASLNGVLKTYFQNGKLSRDCKYGDGEKNGVDIMYYSNGQIRYVDTAAYGISEGVSVEYYPNGKMKSEYRYKTDNVNGICKEFNEKGILTKQYVYENGVSHGPTKYFDENGKLTTTLWYYHGKLLSVKHE